MSVISTLANFRTSESPQYWGEATFHEFGSFREIRGFLQEKAVKLRGRWFAICRLKHSPFFSEPGNHYANSNRRRKEWVRWRCVSRVTVKRSGRLVRRRIANPSVRSGAARLKRAEYRLVGRVAGSRLAGPDPRPARIFRATRPATKLPPISLFGEIRKIETVPCQTPCLGVGLKLLGGIR